MRASSSALCAILTRAGITRAALAGALLGTAIFASGCPKILRGSNDHSSKAPAATMPAESTQAAESAQPAQTPETPNAVGQTTYSYVYCSGFLKDKYFSRDLSIISGEHSSYKVVFTAGEYVYLTHGAEKGIKTGDRFAVVRPETDPSPVEWFKGQTHLERAMGIRYRDLGQITVVSVEPKKAIAQVSFSCDYMQRGDVVRPYEERPMPPLHDGVFDRFAPVSGKPVGMIVSGRDWEQGPVQGNIAYVNLGAAQGVKIGDYLRIFRHEANDREYIPITKGSQYELFGFGSAPERYSWQDLPRQVLGEGVVLNASRNGCTILITHSISSIFAGDKAEVE